MLFCGLVIQAPAFLQARAKIKHAQMGELKKRPGLEAKPDRRIKKRASAFWTPMPVPPAWCGRGAESYGILFAGARGFAPWCGRARREGLALMLRARARIARPRVCAGSFATSAGWIATPKVR